MHLQANAGRVKEIKHRTLGIVNPRSIATPILADRLKRLSIQARENKVAEHSGTETISG
jgi:hypothetical protein